MNASMKQKIIRFAIETQELMPIGNICKWFLLINMSHFHPGITRKLPGAPPPKFDEVKERFPKPVIDDRPDLIDLYWYSWRLQLNEWTFAPFTDDHQLVSNMIGTRSWCLVWSYMRMGCCYHSLLCEIWSSGLSFHHSIP